MFNNKYNTLLTALLVVAIIAIIAIIGYFGYSIYNKYYIEAKANEVINMYEQSIGNVIRKPDNGDANVTIGDGKFDSSIYDAAIPTTYNGYNVIGTISIPKLKIKYPILEKVTTKSLKVAVAYLSGVGINQVGNTVIQGHNYRNGLFFSDLRKLEIGDKIYVKDMSGTEITYEVYRNFIAQDTDGSFFDRDTNGKREITLSTCTEDVTKRTVIFAREV